MNSKPVAHFLVIGLLFATSLTGCGRPTETRRDNRRLLDAILTAVVIRNTKELGKDKELLDGRRKDGKLSQTSFEAIKKLIAEAEEGKWEAAEKGLYKLRKESPFPN